MSEEGKDRIVAQEYNAPYAGLFEASGNNHFPNDTNRHDTTTEKRRIPHSSRHTTNPEREAAKIPAGPEEQKPEEFDSLSPLFEHYSHALLQAAIDSIQLKPDDKNKLNTPKNLRKLRDELYGKDPETFKYENLINILDGYKSDIVGEGAKNKKEKPANDNLDRALEIADEFFNKKGDQVKDSFQEYYIVQRSDGTWDTRTKKPEIKDTIYYAFSKYSLHATREDRRTMERETGIVDKVKDIVGKIIKPPQAKDEQATEEDITYARDYVRILINDLIRRKQAQGQKAEDILHADIALAPLYAYETLLDDKRPNKKEEDKSNN